MDVEVRGKVAIVTGAAQGIGRAIALRLAEAGAEGVLVTDRQPVAGVVTELAAMGAAAAGEVADLEDADAPARIVAACLARFGRVDALVNAAAITDRSAVIEAEAGFYDRIFHINQRAPALLMRGCLEDMRKRRSGAIVNILTVNIYGGRGDLALYASTKAAVALLTKNAAQTHRFERIRVNGIALGWVDTPAERRLQREVYGRGDDYFAEGAAGLPWGRLVSPDDVARLALFLISDASIPITGAIIDQEQLVIGARD